MRNIDLIALMYDKLDYFLEMYANISSEMEGAPKKYLEGLEKTNKGREKMVEMANTLNEVSFLSRQLTAEYKKDIHETLYNEFVLLGDLETEGCTLFTLKNDFKEIEKAVMKIKKWCVDEMQAFRRMEQTAYSSSIIRIPLLKKCSENDKGVVIHHYV